MIEVVRQSVVPLILYLAIQTVVFFAGMIFTSGQERKNWNTALALKTYICGQMLLWAVLQIMAVPMIQIGLSFSTLFYGFLAATVVLAVFGCRRYLRIRNRKVFALKTWFYELSLLTKVLLIAAIVLMSYQVLTYYLGVHIDQDDARWLAEANDAMTYGDMLRRNYSTGEYLGYFSGDVYKELSSPWPMFFAILTKLLHINTPVVAHTLYAPIALFVAYGIYGLIGAELFEKKEARIIFVLAVSLINLFYAGTVYTQSVFSLVRIWQGKATVAGIIIPFMGYLMICINKRDEIRDWIMFGVTGCAACLLSGMGISMVLIMIAVYGLYSIIAYRRWNRILLWGCSMIPSVVFALLYFYYKG